MTSSSKKTSSKKTSSKKTSKTVATKSTAARAAPNKRRSRTSPSEEPSTGKAASKTGSKGSVRKPASKKKEAAPSDSTTVAQKIEKRIAGLGDWRGERLAEIRALIHEVDPEVVEEWKWMGTPVWSHDGMYANANPFKDKVKVTFHQGAHLKDPKKLFNAGLDGNQWRAIDLSAADKINKPAFKALLREAIAYNKTHKVAKSKGSRNI